MSRLRAWLQWQLLALPLLGATPISTDATQNVLQPDQPQVHNQQRKLQGRFLHITGMSIGALRRHRVRISATAGPSGSAHRSLWFEANEF